MATTAKGGSRPVRVVKDANFEPKRVRKARRKSLVRGYLANRVADIQVERQDRAEFHRNLRLMKQRRRLIATEMGNLADMVSGLQRQVAKVEDRHPRVNPAHVDDAYELIKEALISVSVAADEFYAFSRMRIYYVKEIGS